MGKNDIATNTYLKKAERSADLINCYVCNGKQLVRAEDVRLMENAHYRVTEEGTTRFTGKKNRRRSEDTGTHGAKGTYRYHGVWQSIDHVFVSPVLLDHVEQAYINDLPFLLEEDKKYGGAKPLRTYNGMRYQKGFSDHLPLVVRLRF